MKNILVGIFMLMMVVTASAQKRTELKALDAKNYKPWMAKGTQTGYYVKKSPHKLQGPAAKNAKVWDKQEGETKILVISQPREKLMGPEAKNHKIWEHDPSDDSVQRKN